MALPKVEPKVAPQSTRAERLPASGASTPDNVVSITTKARIPGVISARHEDIFTDSLSALEKLQLTPDPFRIALDSKGPSLVDPFDMLKLVRNGTLDVVLPFKEGETPFGQVKAGAKMVLHMRVKNGELDADSFQLIITPPAKWALWASVEGVTIDKDKMRMKLVLGGFPDPTIGPNRMPTRFSDFVDVLKKIDESAELPLQFDYLPTTVNYSLGHDGLARLMRSVKHSEAQISLTHVEFNDGPIRLGPGSYLNLARGSNLTLSGSLAKMTASGRIEMNELRVRAPGIEVDSGSGPKAAAAKFSLTLESQSDGSTSSTTVLEDLELDAQRAVVSTPGSGNRENRLELAQGRLKDGRMTIRSEKGIAEVSEFKIGSFSGAITRGSWSLSSAPAEVRFNRSHVSDAQISYDGKSYDFSGRVDADLDVLGFECSGEGFGLNLKRVGVRGSGEMRYNTASGRFAHIGALHLEAQIASARAVGTAGMLEIAPDSRLAFDTRQLILGPRYISTAGTGSVDLALRNFKGGAAGVFVDGEGSTITGHGNVSIDRDTGITLSDGNLHINTTLSGASLTTPGKFAVVLEGNAKVSARLAAARFNKGALQLELGKSTILAKAQGTITPDRITKQLLPGSYANIDLDTLLWDSEGKPTLTGDLRLHAIIDTSGDSNDISVGGLRVEENGPATQVIEASLRGFVLLPSGAFSASSGRYKFETSFENIKGHLRTSATN